MSAMVLFKVKLKVKEVAEAYLEASPEGISSALLLKACVSPIVTKRSIRCGPAGAMKGYQSACSLLGTQVA